MSGIEVRIDEELCAASALCKRLAPQIFDLPDDADTAIVLQPRIDDPELVQLAEEAESGCPALAIIIDRPA
jgi:ferredoxin